MSVSSLTTVKRWLGNHLDICLKISTQWCSNMIMHPEHLESWLNRLLSPLWASDSVGLGWDLRICISHKFTVMLLMLFWGPQFEKATAPLLHLKSGNSMEHLIFCKYSSEQNDSIDFVCETLRINFSLSSSEPPGLESLLFLLFSRFLCKDCFAVKWYFILCYRFPEGLKKGSFIKFLSCAPIRTVTTKTADKNKCRQGCRLSVRL